MTTITYIDRVTKELKVEKVYKSQALILIYGQKWHSRFLRTWCLPLLTKFDLFSRFYGFLQKRKRSKNKILPFIKNFEVDEAEFEDPVSNYHSFNDFFIRKLKSTARPIHSNQANAIIPADGRYFFFENIALCEGFLVKGQKFELDELLGDSQLAEEYREASLVLARLCPSDYHRFHFPCDCQANATRLINGWLYSVNPIAIRQNIRIMSQNKRTLCYLQSEQFGQILYLEIGATCVGTIQQTYQENHFQAKGNEKGYFEFGGSSLILLFPKNRIRFDADLLEATRQGMEMRCLMGQQMGLANAH